MKRGGCYAWKLNHKARCDRGGARRIVATSIPLDKSGFPTSVSGQSSQYGHFYLHAVAPTHTEVLTANAKLGGLFGGNISGTKGVVVNQPSGVPACKRPIPSGPTGAPERYCEDYCNQGPPPENDLPVKKDSDGKTYARIPYTGGPWQSGRFYVCCPAGYQAIQGRCVKN